MSASMTSPDPHTITRLLKEVRAGDAGAGESLLPLVYDELHGLAGAIFARERSGHTLQPTALIHEAWLKVADLLDRVEDRRHFFIIASRAMRQVLTDHARRVNRDKRGGDRMRVTLDGAASPMKEEGIDLVDLDDSLTRLATLNERHAKVVELRILGGLTIDETAEALGVSHGTIESDWFTAKSWLRLELGRTG